MADMGEVKGDRVTGFLQRIGSARGGHWEVKPANNANTVTMLLCHPSPCTCTEEPGKEKYIKFAVRFITILRMLHR